MICAELENLEAELDEIITALEEDTLSDPQRKLLEVEYTRISYLINDHRSGGHSGGPCYEE